MKFVLKDTQPAEKEKELRFFLENHKETIGLVVEEEHGTRWRIAEITKDGALELWQDITADIGLQVNSRGVIKLTPTSRKRIETP